VVAMPEHVQLAVDARGHAAWHTGTVSANHDESGSVARSARPARRAWT
jgi:hypothetical protein